MFSSQASAVRPLVCDKQQGAGPTKDSRSDFNVKDRAAFDHREKEDSEMHLDDLMAACTTIGYDPKKSGVQESDTKSKSQKKKDTCLAMLEPDVMETDPKKDDRDTAYAQQYFGRVKEALQDDRERFIKFLTLLRDMNKDRSSPLELYADMVTLLAGHQDLVDDFAGFLLAFQAVVCGCLVQTSEFTQIRQILRKLEMYCETTSTFSYQRTLKMMSRWLSLTRNEPTEVALREKLLTTLKQVPGLIHNLLAYFLEETLPDCPPDEFEEVDMESRLEGGLPIDEFEEIVLPEAREDYNTKLCACYCHTDQNNERLRRRMRHCFSCSLKMYNGNPVLRFGKELRPLKVIYPLEEQEKLAKAKKEAAKIALAKARAQKKLGKGKAKKELKRLKKGPVKDVKTKKRKSTKKSPPSAAANKGPPLSENRAPLPAGKDTLLENTERKNDTIQDECTVINPSSLKFEKSRTVCLKNQSEPSLGTDLISEKSLPSDSHLTALQKVSETKGAVPSVSNYPEKTQDPGQSKAVVSSVSVPATSTPSAQNPELVSILSSQTTSGGSPRPASPLPLPPGVSLQRPLGQPVRMPITHPMVCSRFPVFVSFVPQRLPSSQDTADRSKGKRNKEPIVPVSTCTQTAKSQISSGSKLCKDGSTFQDGPNGNGQCNSGCNPCAPGAGNKAVGLPSAVPSQSGSEQSNPMERDQAHLGVPLDSHSVDFDVSLLDTMDMQQLQNLAYSISPTKAVGESMSRFDLMAFIEQSNLTARDTIHNQTTVAPLPGGVSMAGALRKHLAEEASKQVDTVGDGLPLPSATEHQPMDLSTNDQHEKSAASEIQQVTSAGDGKSQWTEELDQVILTGISEGVSLDKLLVHIPGKSLQEVRFRAQFLIEMIQATSDADSESEASRCSDTT